MTDAPVGDPPITNALAPGQGPFQGQGTPLYRTYVLAVLLILVLLSYFDRVLAGIAAPEIRKELGLSDSAIGLINGAAFSIPYLVTSLLLGWYADRTSRVRILAASLTLWAICTAMFGAGRGLYTLLLARIGLGAGEGGNMPTTVLILSDYYPKERLGRVMAVYGFGGIFGLSTGAIVGAHLVSTFGWREAFFLLGAASLVMTPVLLLTIREPLRVAGHAANKGLPLLASLRAMLANRSFVTVCLANGIGVVPVFGIYFWMPSLLVRKLSMDLSAFSTAFGLVLLVSGIGGSWVGGYLADKLIGRMRAAYMVVAGVGYIAAIPFMAGAVMAGALVPTLFFLFMANWLQAAHTAVGIPAFKSVTPPALRGTAAALFSCATIGFGMGVGVPFLGALSDFLRPFYHEASLTYAMMALPVFCAISAVLWLIAARWATNDSEDRASF